MIDNKLIKRFKISEHVIYAPVFLILFVMGILGGRSIGMSISSHGIYLSDTQTGTNRSKGNGQWNLLVLAVDKLAVSHPTLIGIWLLITSPGNYNLTLVPIYPTSNVTSSLKDIAWQETFSLNLAQKPNTGFLEILSDHILWDEYLIIESDEIETVINKFTQSELVFLANTAPEGDKSIKGFENDPNLDRQIEIWQAVCGELQTISDSNELADWLDQIEPYLHTSFDPNKIIHLHNLQKKTHLEFSCEFPTLTLKNP